MRECIVVDGNYISKGLQKKRRKKNKNATTHFWLIIITHWRECLIQHRFSILGWPKASIAAVHSTEKEKINK